MNGDNTQLCQMCMTVKPLTAFSRDKYRPNKHMKYCRRCDSLKNKWYNSDLYPRIKQRFYEQQNGLCPVCGELIDLTQKGQAGPVLDHPHSAEAMHNVETMAAAMTGLLHSNCNRAIGLFRDNPAVLRRAARYVEDSRRYGQQQLDL